MKFLVDAQLPFLICRWLREERLESDHVANLLSERTADQVIAAYAARHGWTVITRDQDFVTLMRSNRQPLVWLRCPNHRKAALMDWLRPKWPGVMEQLTSGATFIEVC